MVKISDDLKNEYPFKSHFLVLGKNLLHFIDEGKGEPILMLHGNPTWSFFYRNLIKHFSKDFRVIAPDHLGCGLSDKPQEYDYTLNNHIENVMNLVEKLELKNITLVLHDWGGAIGMGLATRRPELIKKVIVMNTAAFRSEKIPSRINILRNSIGEIFIRSFNGFAYPATFMASNKKLPAIIKKGFIYPYSNYKNRIATAKFVRDIPMDESHPSYKTLLEIELGLSKVKAPFLILWGEKDFCFTTHFLEKWQSFFPQSKRIIYPNAGHYLIEDELEAVTREVETFLIG